MRIGILGGGQLGRMLALAGHPIGIACRTLEPAAVCPASPVAEHFSGDYEDLQALFRFCQGLDAVTYEFENVPVESARWLAERLPVFPPPIALKIGQERVREKTFFKELGVPVPPFAAVCDDSCRPGRFAPAGRARTVAKLTSPTISATAMARESWLRRN